MQQGTLYEALRLHPPVPGGLQRIAPHGDDIVSGYHIPG